MSWPCGSRFVVTSRCFGPLDQHFGRERESAGCARLYASRLVDLITQRGDLCAPAGHQSSRLRAGWGSVRDDAELRRPTSRLGPGATAELGEDVAHVHVDGARAEDEALGDLAVCETVGDQAQHLNLTA